MTKQTQPSVIESPLSPLIVEYMRQHSLKTMSAFADHSGISRTKVYELLRPTQEFNPSVQTLLSLARTLGKPTHELLYLLVPDAPGAPQTPPVSPRQAAQDRLRALGAGLPGVDDFLRQRQSDSRDDLAGEGQ